MEIEQIQNIILTCTTNPKQDYNSYANKVMHYNNDKCCFKGLSKYTTVSQWRNTITSP